MMCPLHISLNLFLIVLFCLINVKSVAQGFVNKGAEISIMQGGIFSICGNNADYINLNDGSYDGSIELYGDIELKGDWINNSLSGIFKDNLTDGNIIFSGNKQKITGTNYTDFENVVISVTDTLKLDTPETFVHGNFIINKGTFDENHNTIVISKNFENYDDFFADGGKVIFNGNTNQNIISGNNNFYEVIFNNNYTGDYDIDFTQDIIIDKYAEYINGIVYSSNDSKFYFNDGALSNGGTNNSFVAGSVTKIGKDDFIFPVGTVGDSGLIWAPLAISSRSSYDIFTCMYFDTIAPHNYGNSYMNAGLDHVSGIEYWKLDRNAGSSSPYVTLYSKNNLRSGILYPVDIVVANYDTSLMIWSSLNGDYNVLSNEGYITSDLPYSNNSIFTFGTKYNSNPLPVTLLQFKALCNEYFIDIFWTTASETNSDIFIVEKSLNLYDWKFVAEIKSAGNSNTNICYEIKDEFDNSNSIVYYRLKQLDYNGMINVFSPIAVDCSNNDDDNIIEFNIYPNPFNDYINIELSQNIEVPVFIELFDINGNKIFQKNIISPLNKQIKISLLSNMAQGTYLLNISYNDKTYSAKIIKML